MLPARTARSGTSCRGEPAGCSVSSFKVPSAEEFSHTYLWRYSKALPARGMIGIFNRSYYEEVLVVKRCTRRSSTRRTCRPRTFTRNIWKHRYEDINNFEQHLSRNGTTIREVLPERVQGGAEEALPRAPRHPEKNWKFSSATSSSEATGTTTWRPSRTRSTPRAHRGRPGT